MAYKATVLSIFVSSPSDVSESRSTIVSTISAWNQRNGERESLFFNALTWEQVVAPDRSGSGQEVIEEQIGNSYDIYLGVMWSRFGSPTPKSDSGTVDEFHQALERHNEGADLTISFLFDKRPIPQDKLDGLQFQKVQDFKKQVAEKGCLYREYSDDLTLVEAIGMILDRAASKYRNRDGSEPAQSVSRAERKDSHLVGKNDASSELGLLDINEEFETGVSRFTELMEQWALRLEGSGEVAVEATDEMNSISRFGALEPKAVKKIVNKVASSVESVANWGEENQSELDEVIEKLSALYARLVKVSEDFDDPEEDISAAILSGESLVETARDTNKSLKELSETVLSLPRMSKELIKAKKKLASSIDRMMLKNETFASNIEISTSELRNRL